MAVIGEALTEWQLDYEPTPRQLAMHTSGAQEVLFGGAAGPGKTTALLAAGIAFCLAIPNAKALLLRRSYKQLENEIIPRLITMIPREVARYHISEHVFAFKNGATLRLGYLDSALDIYNFQGAEFQLIEWDELTQFTRAQYTYMRSRLRMAGQVARDMRVRGWIPRMIATSNPGGVGHFWVKAMFVDASPSGTVFMGGIEPGQPLDGLRSLVYLPALATQNAHLDQVAYRQQLAGLDPVLRLALELGDWNLLEGTRFPQFRSALHVIEPEQVPIPLIGHALAVGVDYGLSAPFCALWGCLIGETVIIYRELWGANLTAENQAKLILEAERPGERTVQRPIPVALDPSTWERPPNQVIKPLDPDTPPVGSIAYYYRKYLGSAVRKAHNSRINGWQLIDHHLAAGENGLPRLLIYSTCTNLIRTLPAMARSLTAPEDVSLKPKQLDHAVDSLRYLLQQLVGGGHIRVSSTIQQTVEHQEARRDTLRRDLTLDHVPTSGPAVVVGARHAPGRKPRSTVVRRPSGITDN